MQSAVELWQKAVSAVDNACNSFKSAYPDLPYPQMTTENGHRIVVAMMADNTPIGSPYRGGKKQGYAVIGFDQQRSLITVTVNDGPARSFSIKADADHCFITWAQEEISEDKFSQVALEDSFFEKPRAPASKKRGGPPAGGAFA